MTDQATKQCKHCGETKPVSEFSKRPRYKDGVFAFYYINCYCSCCVKLRRKAYWSCHSEYYKEYNRTRRKYQPKEYRYARRRQLEAANPDKYREMREKSKARQRELYNQRIKDPLYNAYEQNRRGRWERANRPRRNAQMKIKSHKRRCLLKGSATDNYTEEQWYRILDYYDNSCLRCGRHESEVEITVDHICPVDPYADNSIDNIQPLCKSCNSVKGNRCIQDYRTEGLFIIDLSQPLAFTAVST